MRIHLRFNQCLLLAAVLIALDQLSKWWITTRFAQQGMGETVLPFFNLVRVHNRGAAFSFLADAGGWQRYFFTIFALVVALVLIHMLRQNQGGCIYRLGLTLILAGAVGNAIDRLIHGYVLDFLDFHWDFLSVLFHGGHFPAFNVADSCISVGVVLLLWGELRKKPRGAN